MNINIMVIMVAVSGTKLWFQKVVGKAESTLRGHNWRAALLTQLPKMAKSQTAPPPLYF